MRKNYKRLTAGLLASTMVLASLTGCGSSNKEESTAAPASTEAGKTEETGKSEETSAEKGDPVTCLLYTSRCV